MQGKKRPIDLVRESALSMTVGDADDQSPIKEIFPIGKALYIIKAKGTYKAQMADDIDPGRTNINVPNTNQRILRYGSEDAIVGRTLLTAKELFRKEFLGQRFEVDKALQNALEILVAIGAMSDLLAEYKVRKALVRAPLEMGKGSKRQLNLPSLGDVKTRVDAFAQQVGHSMGALKGIVRIFYGDKISKKWVDSLLRQVTEESGGDSLPAQYLAEAGPVIKTMIELRNMIEHPQDSARIVAEDFSYAPSGEILDPMLIIEMGTKAPIKIPVQNFMGEMIEAASMCTEALIALLCGSKAESFSGFPIAVAELEMANRRNLYVRYGYVTEINGRVVPFG